MEPGPAHLDATTAPTNIHQVNSFVTCFSISPDTTTAVQPCKGDERQCALRIAAFVCKDASEMAHNRREVEIRIGIVRADRRDYTRNGCVHRHEHDMVISYRMKSLSNNILVLQEFWEARVALAWTGK